LTGNGDPLVDDGLMQGTLNEPEVHLGSGGLACDAVASQTALRALASMAVGRASASEFERALNFERPAV